MPHFTLPTRPLGRTGLAVTELGMGTAPLGGMYRAVPTRDAEGALRAAWDAGIRYFDSAPMYGLGKCEHLLGAALRQAGEDGGGGWVISTKVGRLMRHGRPGAPLPPAAPRNEFDSGWHSGLGFTEVFDYSYDGVMRSYDDSQQRLGLTAIDVLLVHDIGHATHGERQAHHWQALTSGGGFKALGELRAAGCIRGYGLGVNEWEVVRQALEETDLDCCLLAGRYSLLDQSGHRHLYAACQARGVAVIAAGVFNSGILVSGDAKFNYVDAPREIVERAAAWRALAAEHGVPLQAAAVQFPLAHPAVATVVVGVRSAQEVSENVAWHAARIPAAFWEAARTQGWIDGDCPLPAGR